MEVFFVMVFIGALGWGIWYGLFGRFEKPDEVDQQLAPPPLPSRTKPLFDLIRDARANSTMFGFPVIFSSKLDAEWWLGCRHARGARHYSQPTRKCREGQ